MLEKLDPKTDGSSKDIVQDNIQQLKQLFPDVFAENKVDFDALRSALGDYLETAEERYSFNWHGKTTARRIAQTPSSGTLRPCKEESKDWDTTENLFIEGDNLEVLKLLQKSYHKQVKMIYIDPPYNTGKEFIYPDNYQDNLYTYLEYTGQKDNEGRKFGTNTETTGRYHTNWLNMMYPRLKLARNLLREDGVIFISIDDNEVANLRKLCDEIYGEENFVANVIWQKKYAPQNDAKWFSDNHDHIIVYAKKKDDWRPYLLPRSDEANNRYKNPDNDPRGVWKSTDFSRKALLEHTIYEITLPSGRKVLPPKGRSWLKPPNGLQELINQNRIWFGPQGDSVPSVKRFLTEVKEGVTPLTIWPYSEVGHNQDATKELKELFSSSSYFDTPKPIKLLKRIIKMSTTDMDIIVDFFSGSCTTAHSVIELNAQDGGSRKSIMVQLPEPCVAKSEACKAGYKTIADIGKERIRRAGEKIKADNASKEGIENLDIGFKVFKLDSSNIKPWDTEVDQIEQGLFDSVDNIKNDRTAEDVLYELLLKYGIDLTIPIELLSIADKTVYSVGLGALVICLDDVITLDVIEGIGKLKEQLQPEIMHVVLKDAGLKDDVVKTNAIQILKRYDIQDVKTL